MKTFVLWSGSLCFALLALASPPHTFHASAYHANDIITRDVAIVGGGAAGTYAAIGLKDMGKSVIVVEKAGRLGGHAVTYTDPATGGHVDFGVQLYLNFSIVRDFYARLNTPLADLSFSAFGTPIYADFAAGALVNYSVPPLGEDYITELNKYPYLENGIDPPEPVPQDLLLAWPDYINKYNLQDSAPATFARPAIPGSGLDIPALYVFNDLNQVMLAEEEGGAVINANHDNSEIYVNALTELGSDVYLNSTVVAGNRSTAKAGGVQLIIQSPTGYKLVLAKQLVLGIPPILDNMTPFHLDTQEKGVLSQIYGLPYYGGVVKNTGLSEKNSYTNVGANTEFHVANTPNIPNINPSSVDGHFYYWYNSLRPVAQTQVESAALSVIKTMQKLTNVDPAPEPEFVAYQDFGPFHLAVSTNSINKGFYSDMYNLQGYRNTWYIGTLFVTGTSQVWNNTAVMLPDIVSAVNSAR